MHLELGSAAHKPLVLPRARASARRAAVTEPPPIEEEIEEAPAAERYEFETVLRGTSDSSLSRAVDTALGRSVIIERFADGGLSNEAEQRLYALARGGGPFLQRALAYDRSTGVAVFEAPSGAPMSELFTEEPLPPRAACRLFKRMARALAPLHAGGHAHGAITTSTVLVDEFGFPTIMISGVGPGARGATPADDIEATRALVARAIRFEGSWMDLALALHPSLSPTEKSEIEDLCPPQSERDLYRFADVLESAMLRALHQQAS